MTKSTYIGTELELFQHAHHWKAYFAAQIRPFLLGDVAEVGAGIGGSTGLLCDGTQRSWTCIEPDPVLAREIPSRVGSQVRGTSVDVVVGTLADVPPYKRFRSIVYIDVLEHIGDDAAELAMAAARTEPGGHVIVLSPAHQRLYSEFDKAIGHFRRYDAATLAQLAPQSLRAVRVRYLDSLGMFLSFANRALLRQSLPTSSQIAFWDRVVVRASRAIDGYLGYRFGKSILVVWQKS